MHVPIFCCPHVLRRKSASDKAKRNLDNFTPSKQQTETVIFTHIQRIHTNLAYFLPFFMKMFILLEYGIKYAVVSGFG